MASKDQVFEFARQEAIRQGVSSDLVVNMVKTESGGRIDAVSGKGARGPMQLMPATAKELGVNPDDWKDNIRGGVKYINQMLRQFNDPVLAVAAYNAGPRVVRRANGIPEFKET
jgi:soluble lytic murein transglycosylase-like protein